MRVTPLSGSGDGVPRGPRNQRLSIFLFKEGIAFARAVRGDVANLSTVSISARGVVMSGRRPLIKGFFGVALIVGAVMSSAFRADNWIRWP
jgi:hypothetical protein